MFLLMTCLQVQGWEPVALLLFFWIQTPIRSGQYGQWPKMMDIAVQQPLESHKFLNLVQEVVEKLATPGSFGLLSLCPSISISFSIHQATSLFSFQNFYIIFLKP